MFSVFGKEYAKLLKDKLMDEITSTFENEYSKIENEVEDTIDKQPEDYFESDIIKAANVFTRLKSKKP